ncbi:MAG: hypothetical protein S0880_00255 [Actinomycetota bacterium]|nr:hypothetical protein [Actinomycetota bacterium]
MGSRRAIAAVLAAAAAALLASACGAGEPAAGADSAPTTSTTSAPAVRTDELVHPDFRPSSDGLLRDFTFTPGDVADGMARGSLALGFGGPVVAPEDLDLTATIVDIEPVARGDSSAPMRTVVVEVRNDRTDTITVNSRPNQPDFAILLDTDDGYGRTNVSSRDESAEPVVVVAPGDTATVYARAAQPYGPSCEPAQSNDVTPCAGEFELYVLFSVITGYPPGDPDAPYEETGERRVTYSTPREVTLPAFFWPDGG